MYLPHIEDGVCSARRCLDNWQWKSGQAISIAVSMCRLVPDDILIGGQKNSPPL